MNVEQMRLVHRALTQAIAKTACGVQPGMRPKFSGFTHKPGWILVTCLNKASQDWIVSDIGKLKPWLEAELSIIPESELPKPQLGITFLPRSEADSPEEVAVLLRAQNEGLHTEIWKILHRRDEENGFLVTFSLDDPSAETLRALDGRVVLGFKMITFKVRGGFDAAMEPVPPQLQSPQTSTSRGETRTKSISKSGCGADLASFRGPPLLLASGNGKVGGSGKPKVSAGVISAGKGRLRPKQAKPPPVPPPNQPPAYKLLISRVRRGSSRQIFTMQQLLLSWFQHRHHPHTKALGGQRSSSGIVGCRKDLSQY
ncbi:unnamed protein product [Parnassius mnemosyne]|uniref:DUF4780 domain-containing protein n=1 Tax=Parnassius mnemosyne TaxID=213953 RepID=A0AAV1M249_9NEOP